mmetsp:Transcript_23716/g.36411  ORF Transcript_23716/g.36411 Transcript_23716/m.36411 type:complete len:132 (+) Transcript_23716:55-450(+)
MEAHRRVDRCEMEMNDLLSHQMNLQVEGFYENIDAFIEEEKRGFKDLGLLLEAQDKPQGFQKGRGRKVQGSSSQSRIPISKKKSQHDTLTSAGKQSIEEPTTFRQKQTHLKVGGRSQFTRDRNATVMGNSH